MTYLGFAVAFAAQSGRSGMSGVPVEEYLCARIRRAEQALMAHHEAVLRGYGLSVTQYTVLLMLSRSGGMSGAQIARACGVTQQTMAGVLGGLQAKSMIDRHGSTDHAKVQIASLTNDGRALLEQAYGEVILLQRALTDSFSTEEYSLVCELLERATKVLIDQTQPVGSNPTKA
jgi:MarR family transcriptional regulator, organic hydroperoxide resistance regulator